MLRLPKMFGIDPTVGSVCNRVWDTIDGIQKQVSDIPAAAWHQSLTKVWDTIIVSHQVFAFSADQDLPFCPIHKKIND
jgi:hypothetical protein